MAKKRGLGKSLNALLAFSNPDAQAADESSSHPQDMLCQLSVTRIQCGAYQPRREMDPQALEELANSIRAQGIIQPLIVRPVGEQYEIVAGERRWRAAQLAGLTEVPVVVRSIPDEAALAIALIENIQRENLNPIEEAVALQRLMDEFGMTHQETADAIGKPRTTVTNLLRLLALPEKIKLLLEQRRLDMGHARALLTLPQAMQWQAADRIVAQGLSVRETEQLVRRLQSSTTRGAAAPMDPDVRKLQDSLSRQLNMRVAIQYNAKGKGKLTIHYRNLKELDELLSQFQREVA